MVAFFIEVRPSTWELIKLPSCVSCLSAVSRIELIIVLQLINEIICFCTVDFTLDFFVCYLT